MKTEMKTAKLFRVVAVMAALAFTAAACGSDSAGTAPDDTASGDAASDVAEETATTTAGTDDMDDGHSHDTSIEVPDSMTVPTIGIEVEEDPVAGMNLFVDIADFEIAPRSASTEPVDGQGHLHLYVDGERVQRFYNTALHLDSLSEGEHEIAVEVSANNHSAYAVDGEPIRATTTVTVPASEGGHDHGDSVDGGAVDEGAVDGIEVEGDAPVLSLEVLDDPKEGWNVLIDVENFEFAPRSAGLDPVKREGHLHLMVDGVKMARLYGGAYHIKALSPGEHEIMVVANHNDHQAYLVDGKVVAAMATITVEGEADVSGDDMGDAVVIETTISGGDIETTSGDQSGDRITVALGDEVMIMVTGDVTDEIHLHGYDIHGDLVAGDDPAVITFTADVPGVFEIELESAGTFLFEIQVDS